MANSEIKTSRYRRRRRHPYRLFVSTLIIGLVASVLFYMLLTMTHTPSAPPVPSISGGNDEVQFKH
jgi:hypothetical protein